MKVFGCDPIKFGRATLGVSKFISDSRRYKKSQSNSEFPLLLRNVKPVLTDYYETAGVAGGHYFHQDLWAAKLIFRAGPTRHIDIGSRIDGFVAHLLTFMQVEVIDIRPLPTKVEGLSFIQEDATHLRSFSDNTIESLSCLHAVEHFGLGRYSDPVDAESCFHAMRAMQRVLQYNGRLYFSTPIGRQRLEFNSQRVFSTSTVLSNFNELKLISFSCVNDEGNLLHNVNPADFNESDYCCGLFEFTK